MRELSRGRANGSIRSIPVLIPGLAGDRFGPSLSLLAPQYRAHDLGLVGQILPVIGHTLRTAFSDQRPRSAYRP